MHMAIEKRMVIGTGNLEVVEAARAAKRLVFPGDLALAARGDGDDDADETGRRRTPGSV